MGVIKQNQRKVAARPRVLKRVEPLEKRVDEQVPEDNIPWAEIIFESGPEAAVKEQPRGHVRRFITRLGASFEVRISRAKTTVTATIDQLRRYRPATPRAGLPKPSVYANGTSSLASEVETETPLLSHDAPPLPVLFLGVLLLLFLAVVLAGGAHVF